MARMSYPLVLFSYPFEQDLSHSSILNGYNGKHYHLEQISIEPEPFQKPHPPSLIGILGSSVRSAVRNSSGVVWTRARSKYALRIIKSMTLTTCTARIILLQ
jgi:hypothetical protein